MQRMGSVRARMDVVKEFASGRRVGQIAEVVEGCSFGSMVEVSGSAAM